MTHDNSCSKKTPKVWPYHVAGGACIVHLFTHSWAGANKKRKEGRKEGGRKEARKGRYMSIDFLFSFLPNILEDDCWELLGVKCMGK